MTDAIVWLIMLPLLASLLCLVWPRHGGTLALIGTISTLIMAVIPLHQSLRVCGLFPMKA